MRYFCAVRVEHRGALRAPSGCEGDALQKGFTAGQALRLTGCTHAQLRYWDSVGLVKPTIQQTGGRSGVPRLYSFQDLVRLRVVRSMKDNGMSLQRIRRAWGYLIRQGADPARVKFVTDGVSIYGITPDSDEMLDALREGQLAMFVELGRITSTVEDDVSKFELDRDRFLDILRGSEEEVRSQVAGAGGS